MLYFKYNKLITHKSYDIIQLVKPSLYNESDTSLSASTNYFVQCSSNQENQSHWLKTKALSALDFFLVKRTETMGTFPILSQVRTAQDFFLSVTFPKSSSNFSWPTSIGDILHTILHTGGSETGCTPLTKAAVGCRQLAE